MPTHLILHLAGRQNVRDHRGTLLRDVGGCGVKKKIDNNFVTENK